MTEITLLKLFKKSWINAEETPETWLKALEIAVNKFPDSSDKYAELGFVMRETIEKISSQLKNFEKCSLPNFVGLIYDTELYTRYMKENFLTRKQIEDFIGIYNELSMEPCLSLASMETTTTSSTTATGALVLADAQESDVSKSTEKNETNDIDIIEKLLAPQLGTYSTGSICSSISIQQEEGLTMLKYPAESGYAIVEVNLGQLSKLANLDSSEAWKAYDFRMKMIVSSPLDPIHILAMKLIRNITENLKTREDFKRTVFRTKTGTKRAMSPEPGPSFQSRPKKVKAKGKRSRF